VEQPGGPVPEEFVLTDLQDARAALEEVTVGKISGAVGTHATVPPQIEEFVCEQLGLSVAPASSPGAGFKAFTAVANFSANVAAVFESALSVLHLAA
jgi:adenylosuccinate lyase